MFNQLSFTMGLLVKLLFLRVLFLVYVANAEDDYEEVDREKQQEHSCRSSKWYLDNICTETDIPDEYIVAYGQVRNEYKLCLDDLMLGGGRGNTHGRLSIFKCHGKTSKSQDFLLNAKGQLSNRGFCADASHGYRVNLVDCNTDIKEQYWVYKEEEGVIYSPFFNKCISSEGVGSEETLVLEDCWNSPYQRWTFEHMGSLI